MKLLSACLVALVFSVPAVAQETKASGLPRPGQTTVRIQTDKGVVIKIREYNPCQKSYCGYKRRCRLFSGRFFRRGCY